MYTILYILIPKDYKHHLSSNIFDKIRNRLKTGAVLNQAEGTFLDFKRAEFEDEAIFLYEELAFQIMKKQKLEISQLVSYPYYNVIFGLMKAIMIQ